MPKYYRRKHLPEYTIVAVRVSRKDWLEYSKVALEYGCKGVAGLIQRLLKGALPK